jgi:hypothetical protein
LRGGEGLLENEDEDGMGSSTSVMSSIVGCRWLVDGGGFSSEGERSTTEILLVEATGDGTGDGE